MKATVSLWIPLIGIAGILLPGCGSSGSGSSSSNLPATSQLPARVADAAARNAPVDSGLVTANTHFAFQLFDRLRTDTTQKNVVVSPASIALALQITSNGARTTTQEAMLQTLQLPGATLPDLNNKNAALQAALFTSDPQVTLNIANALWVRNGGKDIRADFVQANTDYYGSEIGDLAGAPDNANAWVESKTNGKIKNILPNMDYRDIVAVVINAVYFKATWTSKFSPAHTQDGSFTRADGTQATERFMSQTGSFGYLKGDGFQAVRLPYGQKRFAIYLFLPDANHTLDDFLTGLTAEKWGAWIPQFAEKTGSVTLPRVTTSYEADLKPSLTDLGMGVAFDPQHADFTGLKDGVFIRFVRHKTYLAIDEDGTEAAAATAIGGEVTSAPVLDFTLRFDRPFFFAIRDDKTGTLLFVGAIKDPS